MKDRMTFLKAHTNTITPEGYVAMVIATASDVDYHDIYDLELAFYDSNGIMISEMVNYDPDYFAELELELHDKFMDAKEKLTEYPVGGYALD
jgi:hypothetical protein